MAELLALIGLLLAVVWVFLLRYVPDRPMVFFPGPSVPNRSDLLRAFAPKAAWMLLFYALWHRAHVEGRSVDGDVWHVLGRGEG